MNHSRSLRTLTCSTLALAATLALSACAGRGGSAAPASRSADPMDRAAQQDVKHDAWAALGYRLVWRGFPIMADGARPEGFQVYDDAVVVHNSRNVMTFMEGLTGANRWSNQLAGPLTRFVGFVRDDNLIYASSDNELFVLDAATGEIDDRQRLALVVNTAPTLQGDVLVYGTNIGEVLGHSLVTRYKYWGYSLSGAISAQPADVGRFVGAVSQGGDVIVIDPSTGSSTSRAQVFAGLANDPVGGEDALYVASLDQSVYAFSAIGGRQIWRYRTQQPIRSQPTYYDGILYIALEGEGMVAFDAATGDKLWTNPDIRGEIFAIRDGRLLGRDGDTFYALEFDRGDVLESVTIPGISDIAVAEFEDGDLYTMTAQGVVAKFMAR
ncbi:MAG: PQQ-binding-like beta-propeller repeat protein [Planctomycetota bacterium]|nr:PQQ-binding-like beta-propeller repeat protein [Planctomycetota bacterium]